MKSQFIASKKVKMTLVGLITEFLMFVVIYIMRHAFTIDVSHELQLQIHQIIALIVGAFLASQGFADGVSKGKTSSAPND